MFVILNVVSSGKRKVRKGQTVRKVSEYQTGGGERFYVVDICDSETGINWDEIGAFIGRHSAGVLADKNLYLPADSGIKRFNTEKFFNIILFNTLNIVLKELYLSGFRTKCYVNDKSGKYSFLLPGIVRYSGETVVVTGNEYRYFSQIHSLYDDMGAGVTLTDKTCEPEAHAFIIDTDGTFPYDGKGVLFSATAGLKPCAIEGFDELKKMCPEHIEINDFLAALYELNRERRLSHAFCRTMSRCDEELSVFELIQELKLRISASPDRRKSIIFYV